VAKQRQPGAQKRAPRLSANAVAFSRNLSHSAAVTLAAALHRRANLVKAVVAAFDIRESTTFMLHLEDFDAYASQLAEFMAYIRYMVTKDEGWFDKFTGDGAIVFWVEDTLSRKE